jgi:hypothetical protein
METAEPFLEPSAVNFVGPFEHYDVVVNGRRIPFLSATPMNGGRVHLTIDNRLGIDLSVEEAERFVPFLADGIAVALGYTCHPEPEWEGPTTRQPFPRMMPLPNGT